MWLSFLWIFFGLVANVEMQLTEIANKIFQKAM